MENLPEIHNIAVINQPIKLTKKWCVYTLTDVSTNKIVYVGHIKLLQLFAFIDARLANVDLNKFYTIRVIELCENSGLALRSAMIKTRELGLKIVPKSRSFRVYCVNTGETFNSIKETCMVHGLQASNLSNHLNNKPGFNTVKGKTYKKINV